MRFVSVALLALSLPSCVIGGQLPKGMEEPTPVVEVAPGAPAPALAMPPAEPTLAPLPEPVWPEPVPAMAAVEPPPAALTPSPRRAGSKSDREPSPHQLIKDAQQQARIAPSRQGYFGGSGVQRYLWQPGKIWDVYLTPGAGTKILFPPGERLAHALILNPKSFDVNTATVGGSEEALQTLILIRPCATSEPGCVGSPPVDVGLTSISGRAYNLHLIVGSVGMVEVTWEVTPIPYLQMRDPEPRPRRLP